MNALAMFCQLDFFVPSKSYSQKNVGTSCCYRQVGRASVNNLGAKKEHHVSVKLLRKPLTQQSFPFQSWMTA
jgi:hypothetical protein